MANDVQIVIQAKNLTDQAFREIVNSAKSTGQAVEEAGTKGARGLDDLEKRATAVGAAFGALATGMSYAGQQATNQRREVDALNRIYGDGADAVLKYSKRLQDATNFSDEQARQSAITASTLSKSYGITVDQVELLISRSADLAQTYGRDLTDVIERTSAAVRGEGESAEALSITLNDTYVASQAAARGLTGWNTTMTDSEKAQFRLQLLLEQTATLQGAATEAAEGARGKAIDLQQAIQDNIVTFGEWLGPLGETLGSLGQMSLLLPVVTGGIGKLTGALAAAGLGTEGAAALGLLGPGVLLAGAGSLAYGYGQDTYGTTAMNQFWNEFFKTGSAIMNQVLPGSPFSTKKYTDQENTNALWDQVNAILRAPGEDQVTAQRRIAELLNIPGGNYVTTNEGGPNGPVVKTTFIPPSKEEIESYLINMSRTTGLAVEDIVLKAAKTSTDLVFDAVTKTFMAPSELQQMVTYRYGYTGTSNMNYGALGSKIPAQPVVTPRYYGDVTPMPEYIGPYQPATTVVTGKGVNRFNSDVISPTGLATDVGRGGGRIAPESVYPGNAVVGQTSSLVGANANQELAETAQRNREIVAALGDEYAGYVGLVEGINSTADAQRAFSATQTIVIQQQSVYSQQLSEYSGQESALTDAYDILQQRKTDGVKLTKEEQDLLDNYPELYGRIKGGEEDATVSAGLLAAQYIENMKAGDQMNKSLSGVAGSVAGLATTVRDLIFNLNGIPPEVKTQILVEDLATGAVDAYYRHLNQLNGYSITTYIHEVTTHDDQQLAYHRLGGVVGYARGGVVARMGEAGAELLTFRGGGQALALTDGLYDVPPGTFVTPAPATRDRFSGADSGARIAPAPAAIHLHVHGNLIGDNVKDLALDILAEIAPQIDSMIYSRQLSRDIMGSRG